MPQEIITTTDAQATTASNQKLRTALASGRDVVVVADTATNAKFLWSDNGFVTETDYGSDIAGWSNGSIESYVDSGGTERLVAVWEQSGVGGGRTDGHVYVMVGTFNGDRTTLTWGAAKSTGGGDYPDLCVVADDTGGQALLSASVISSGSVYPLYLRQPIAADGTIAAAFATDGLTVFGGGLSWGYHSSYVSAVHAFVSHAIDPDTKRLFATWSAGGTGAGKGIRFRTASYAASAWTWAAEVEVSTGHYLFSNNYGIQVRWDAERSLVVIGAFTYTGALDRYAVWDSSNFTVFTNRYEETHNGVTSLSGPSFAIDPATGDLHLFGSLWDSGYENVSYYKLTRTGSSLEIGSRVELDSFVGTSTPPFVNAFPVSGGIGWIYTRGNNSPYQVVYDQEIFNTIPSVVLDAPADGSLIPQAGDITLEYTVTDPDPDDSITKIAVRRRRIS